ncbi:MAG TPA: DUF1631 domain-containing protein [Xanthomonadaceae bacterium]|nr:DUF1631 domain-containing protein [Xanthomonadaceae bacterium]
MTQQPDIGQSRPRQVMADLHKRIHACAIPRLAALVRETLDAVDDALFDMAEKANSNAEQARYFDGMREVRRRRGDIEHRFQERLVQGLVEFAEGRARRTGGTGQSTRQPQDSLSLVENEELEQSLAVTAMASRAEGKLGRTLYALNRRLEQIVAAAEVDDDNNPLAPAALASAFRAAIEPLECTIEIRLILLKLFDRLVIDALEPIYGELNELLVAAGILPKVPTPVAQRRESQDRDATAPPELAPVEPAQIADSLQGRSPTGPHSTPAGGGAAPPVSHPAGAHPGTFGTAQHTDDRDPFAEDDQDSPFSDEVYRSIYTLMAAQRTARHYAGSVERHAANDPAADAAGAEAGRADRHDDRGAAERLVVDVGDLLSALSMLQGEFSSAGEAPSPADQVKHRLLDHVGRLGVDAESSQIRPRDEHTIDLVGMVFDYILQDQNLPPAIQVLLARLQIPYIKVALLDPRFFAMRSHPARRLLDELSQAGIGWSEASDPDRRLYDRISGVVDTVLRQFDDNLALFDRLLSNFRGFVAAERRRAEVAEQRAAEATRGRERLLGARRRAAREVLERVRGRDLPRVIHNVLTRPWANFLVLTLLRQGEDSQAWVDAVRFADDLAWAAEPKTDPEERERLLQMIPQIERMLRHGLTTVAYHDSDIQKLSAELVHLLESQVDPDCEPTELAHEAEDELHLPGEPLVQPLDSSLEDPGARADIAPGSPLQEAWVQRARDLTIGTWVEFRRTEGPNERARLSWTSPVSGRHLFVNHKGLKVCDRSPERLAEELESGTASVLESSALVDRALNEILARLRKQRTS